MGKAIRFNHICFKSIFFLVIFPLCVSQGFAQIIITDTRSFEVSFSDEESKKVPGGIELSVHDPAISSSTSQNGRIQHYSSTQVNQEGSFYVTSYGDISLGTYYHQSSDYTLSSLPVINGTSKSLNKLSVAFDFVYLPKRLDQSHSFNLSYRINDGVWINPKGGAFSSEFLQEGGEVWSTFSMQITLDQLFLRPNDKIELRWSSSSNGSDSFLPIALQKIEFYPVIAKPVHVRPGSLIISELMPRYQTDRGFVEYVEIYNSTESPINLKGLILEAGFDAVVIQHNLIVDPYKTVVIANFEAVNRFDTIADYKYSGTLLGNLSGRLEAKFEQKDVAKALYDGSEAGVALQLDHLQNAYDGYSGMRHFTSVRQRWNNILYGNPGTIDGNRKLFTKTFSQKGWHIFTPPGNFSNALNREYVEYITTFFPEDESEDRLSGTPYMYYHSGESPVTLSTVASDMTTESDDNYKKLLTGMNLVSLNNPLTDHKGINSVVNQQDNQAFPVLLVWNSATQSFQMVWSHDDKIAPWSAIFAPEMEEIDYDVQLSDKTGDDTSWAGLRRMLQLSLVKEGGTNQRTSLVDQALIGFWDTPAEIQEQRMDLPKIWNPLSEHSDEQRTSLIYLKSADAAHQTNSYLNFARTPKEVVQVAIGVRLDRTNGRYRIEWDDFESLPDHWEIQFVDAELEETVNMRNEQSYSFTERNDQVTEGMGDPDLNFLTMEQTDYTRFFVRVSSSGLLGMFERDDEFPESIELKQNYPNPFNPSTTIVFYLPNSSQVRIGVYNIVGQQVGVLLDDRLSAGEHSVMWNALDMPSGVYIVQMEAGSTVKTRKITLIK